MNAIVVEDEQIIRNGILEHIPWGKLGIDHVVSAKYAVEAFEKCEQIKPDIIISDINMPGMNGVTLCRSLREKFPESEIIFVTGFSDKEYLKAAIELHAVSYVEKPIDIQELTQAVGDAVERVEKNRCYQSAFVQSLFTNSNSMNYILTKDRFFEVCLIHHKSESDYKQAADQLNEKMAGLARNMNLHFRIEQIEQLNTAVLFSHKEHVDKKLSNAIQAFYRVMEELKVSYFMAFGTEEEGQERIQISYEAAEQALKCLSYRKWNCIAVQKDIPHRTRKFNLDMTWMEQFTQAIAEKERDKAMGIVEDITRILAQEQLFINADIRYIYYKMEDIVMRFQRNVSAKEVEAQYQGERTKAIESAQTLDDLEQYICGLIRKNDFKDDENNNSYVIQKVMDYVQGHYNESGLSINTLSEHVYLTPTYLSNLFKKNVGITIGQYIVNMRVEQAKLLLQNPKWKLYQVAPMVGYEDSNYFAKIFKKKVGVTPSEYRGKMVL